MTPKQIENMIDRLMGNLFLKMWCFLCTIVIIAFIIIIFFQKVDPTDQDRWNRSGLRYYKDHGTGREYISGPGGVLRLRDKPVEGHSND